MKTVSAQQVYWIEGPWRGGLAIVPRPRGGDWLEDEITSWREAGIDVVVSFLMPDEVSTFLLENEGILCEDHGIGFVSFPIRDRGVPTSLVASESLLRDLEQSLTKGKNVALHCRQSIGRSALIAASLLVKAGEEPRSAFDWITLTRGSKVPDTAEQAQWVADRDSQDKRTKGERLFKSYLGLQGITRYEFERDHAAKHARPDYTVKIEDREYIFEVKDFASKDLLGSGAYDPYSRIRQKIEMARREFKEYKEWPCCLVLYNNNASLVHLEEPEIMLSCMYGNYGLSIEFDPALGEFDPVTERWGFHEGGKMFRPKISQPQNTTISALITLRYVEVGRRKLDNLVSRLMKEKPEITPAELLREARSVDLGFDQHERHLGVIVWENAFARIPFPQDVFCGPYDVRWGQLGSTTNYGVVFRGSEMLDYRNEKDLRSQQSLEPTPM